jgi:hypothetical protein
MNDALRYKLRIFGIPIDGPTNSFCDNKSVVTNVANPESTLSKKHNSIAYHKVRECVAMKALRVSHEPGKMNCSDILTKFLGYEAHFNCCGYILFPNDNCVTMPFAGTVLISLGEPRLIRPGDIGPGGSGLIRQ